MTNFDNVVKYSKDLTLLYVEDDQHAREMTAMILEDFFDNIIIAEDGEDGLEKFKSNKIDLVITDINMPKLNGLDMAVGIRAIDNSVPIIIISAHNEDKLFIKSIQIDIDGYILKPIDIDHLINTLYKVVQKYKYIDEAKRNLHFLKVYQEAANLSSIVSKTDTRGIITYVNEAFCEISGYTQEELIGKNHNIVRHPDNPKELYKTIWNTISKEKKVWRGIVRNRAKDGKSYYVDSLIMPILDIDGNIIEYMSLRHNITEIMNPLKVLKNSIKDFKTPLLLYMKLDKYDIIEEFYDNDTVELIQEKVEQHLYKRFKEIYSFDRVYTLGNGEFAILIDCQECSLDTKEIFVEKLRNLQNTLKEDTIPLDTIEFNVNIIISVVYEKEKALDSAKLGIKRLIKDNKDFIIANNLAEIEQNRAKENMKTVSMIQHALKTGNIISYFQPIIDNKTKEIVKYESLVRLIDESGKVVSPFFFLDTAKKSNYYTQITNRVLQHSFDVLELYGINISINLSALDIERQTTREHILSLVEKHQNKADKIVFELLEDENVKEFDIIKEFITDVKKYGVQIAIDDFGAGYSNFERLLDYQPDILKIDGCLIRDIETSDYSLSVVKSIVTFAKEQNIQTIAEFIENERIFNIVKDLGVDYSQGYYFNKPEPITYYIK